MSGSSQNSTAGDQNMQSNISKAIDKQVKPDAGLGMPATGELLENIVPGVHTLGGQRNTLAIETARGVIIVDAGPGGCATEAMIARLRELTPAPVLAIVYSHGHAGYNRGVPQWLKHAALRGEPRPTTISHEGVPASYQRQLQAAPLQAWINNRENGEATQPYTADDCPMPDQTFGSKLVIDGADRTVELLSAPSETDDALAVWLPAERFLYSGLSMSRGIPNVGMPLRTLRDPMRWATTLERLHALAPLCVLRESGAPINDPKDIEDAFLVPVRALRYLRQEVVKRMNAGMNEREILHDMVYPESFFDHQFMRPIFGSPDYIVRAIWRTENGWWDRNPANLHPARPADAANAVLSALLDSTHILDEAWRLQAQGEIQLAMHVIDLLALSGEDRPDVKAARQIKAQLCRQRAMQVSSVVSRQILLSSAEELLGLPIGSTSAGDPPASF
ncbi:alkyl sulfatase dimerization domain-containing protein [Paraburkholderia nemoris]|uniref:alkyl sulfatase dimerization domain-containing protein n=1 Tax=Paraburkholderia nemoris TaxID=2793076 RepID=UPI0038BB046E